MKRSQIYFTTALLPLDLLMLILAAITAYQFRIGSFVAEIRPVIYTLRFQDFILYSLLTAVIWQVIFAFSGLYNIRSNRRLSQEFGKIFLGCSIGLLIIVFAIFMKRELFSSRFIIIAAWAFAILYLTIGRACFLVIQKKFFKKGLGAIKVAVIGQGPAAEAILQEIKKNSNYGFKVIKTFSSFNQGAAEEISRIHEEIYLDEIFSTDANMSKEELLSMIDFADENHLGFRYAPDVFNTLASNISVDTIAGIPIVELKRTPLDGWGKVAKRIFDIIASSILIILTSPVTLLTALAVRFESTGPIIFKNERVGEKGKVFDTLKFRSMKSEFSIGKQFEKSNEALAYEQELIKNQNVREGAVYKIVDDPRLTRVGRFIRKWSMDELPQFLNVLKGEMSLVGPRPHQPREVAKYEKHQRKLLTIKPGITGMAQVSGRSDLSFEDEAKLDIFYIENWSLWLDLQILLKTPIAVLKSRKTL